MNPTPETLGKAKGKISSSCQSSSETESFSRRYLRAGHKFVPAYCHSYCFAAKCSFTGLTYAGCVDTRTQPGGERFLPSLLHFYWALPDLLCQDHFLQKTGGGGLLPAAGLPLLPHVAQHNRSISPCLCKGSCSSPSVLFRGVILACVLLRSDDGPRWRRWLCYRKAANSGDAA